MNHDYGDIIERAGEPPKWWDENAVPRFCAFEPRALADIYARECALVEVACQACGHRFPVAFSLDVLAIARKEASIASQIRTCELHYGDPPNACPERCISGATMNSVPLRVIEYWSKGDALSEWTRDATLEVAITPDWGQEWLEDERRVRASSAETEEANG